MLKSIVENSKGGVPVEIKEYQKYCEDEILRLYASVGWTAYTERPEASFWA